jgi:hypothetical protein
MRRPISDQTRTNALRPRNSRSRRTSLERLEDRRLLSYADFELSSLLPANGGDGSKGVVVDGVTDRGRFGAPGQGYHSVGDVNQDGIDDFFIAALGTSVEPASLGRVYLVFGRSDGFPASFDLQSLNGTNGYRIDGVQLDGTGAFGGGAGDLNHDGAPDLAIGAHGADPAAGGVDAGAVFVLYGGAHLAALDLADGASNGIISLSNVDGLNGFTINAPVAGDHAGMVSSAGDLNGDHIDDLAIATNWAYGKPGKAYVVFGRDSTIGNVFPATFELSSLNGSNGFAVPGPFGTNSAAVSGIAGGGDVNGDGIGDLVIASWTANVSNLVNPGQAFVIFGRASFPASFNVGALNGSNGFTINGGADDDWLGGFGADIVGDVNGDGVDDVMIAVRGLDSVGGVVGMNGSNVGGAVVVFGRTTTFPSKLVITSLDGSNGFAIRGVNPGDSVGTVSGAGDVNGDGYSDMLLASTTADPHGVTDAGQSYLVYGRSSFGTNFELSSLLAANGGDGSAGLVLNGFAPSGQLNVAGLGDINGDGFADFRVAALLADVNGMTDNGQAYILYGKPSPAPVTKFYVVNDGGPDRTYEYTAAGAAIENYAVNSGNSSPRGAASTVAGDKVWVVDANKNVYVYNTSGGLLGSWAAGSLASNATVEGIATNGTDVWIVDAQQDKVFRYTGAASRLSGSQTAASSFALNSSNTSPKDVVTDGTNLWVVNDSTTDKVFKYSLTGSLAGTWTITGAGSSPTGITLDPAGGGTLWIVDSGTDRVYQFDNARSRTSGSQSPSTSFALAAGNTNPPGIADPPAATSSGPRTAILRGVPHLFANRAARNKAMVPNLRAWKPAGRTLSTTAVRMRSHIQA